MTKGTKGKERKRSPFVDPRDPWIKGRTGVLIIAVLSVIVAIFTGVNVYRMAGALDKAFVMGIGSAVGLWILFGALYLFNRLFRGRR
jgi:hypothetical protein